MSKNKLLTLQELKIFMIIEGFSRDIVKGPDNFKLEKPNKVRACA